MSNRLYYTDSYTTQFNAAILEQVALGEQTAVVLDQTYFYPTSGGQPCDSGMINGTAVVDVQVRAEDGAVLHLLAGPPAGGQATGVIDWDRRFDHMQQHTGQHILSQAFIQTVGAQTVGFHLSEGTVTIDLDQDAIDEAALADAERLANEIVWQDLPVAVRFVTHEQAAELPLRKIPPTNGEKLRLVDIVGFDLTACGGTHVARTGEVGLIKIVKKEQRGDKTRIEFRCGARALAHYGEEHAILTQLTSQLTTGAGELATAVAGLQDNEKQLRREVKQLQTDLFQYRAQEFLAGAEQVGDLKIVKQAFAGIDAGQLRVLAATLAAGEKVVVLLGVSGEKAQLIFGRAADAPGTMNLLLRETLAQLGSKSGGGSETLAQGVVPNLSLKQVEEALNWARGRFVEEFNSAS
jgi:alanyl-tRNA synthetase